MRTFRPCIDLELEGCAFICFFATDFGKCSVPEAMIFESETPAFGFVESGKGINDDAASEQVSQLF
jgi:hypothetical protein